MASKKVVQKQLTEKLPFEVMCNRDMHITKNVKNLLVLDDHLIHLMY